MTPQLQTFHSLEEFITASTDFIAIHCPKKDHPGAPVAAIGLSGGSTPGPIYSALGQSSDIEFSKVEFFQVDERYVPADHDDANYKMIKATLQKPFHYFDTSLTIEECVDKYAKELATINPTVTILGIGPDGHTASLFPDSPALTETTKTTAHTTTAEFAIHDRLTITFPIILSSKTLLVLMKGRAKKEVLDTVLNSDKSIADCPAKKLLEHPNLHIFFGDF